MRIIAQRVLQASVSVEGKTISKIGRGLLILVGFNKGDDKDTIDHMTNKTINMRLWGDQGKSWSQSVKDIDGEILVVSQFTLYAKFKGNKPDFHGALTANQARLLYDQYVALLRQRFGEHKVQTGQFQAMMVVSSSNDGPVTIYYDKPGEKEPTTKQPAETQPKVQEQVPKQ